jgi:hypothetical protein
VVTAGLSALFEGWFQDEAVPEVAAAMPGRVWSTCRVVHGQQGRSWFGAESLVADVKPADGSPAYAHRSD